MEIGFLTAMTAQGGDIVEIARATEAAGFESLWIPEHPVIPAAMKTVFPFTPVGKLPEHYGRWADPFVGLAAAAAVTKRIKLGIGAGWLREETEVMGSKFGSRWKRTREAIEAMRALWSHGTALYEGELVRFESVRCEPRPVQRPGPPVILGAHGPKALERVARTYDGWMPLVRTPEELKPQVVELRKLLKERSRPEISVQISPIVDPKESGPSADELKQWRDAGAGRIILLSQQTVAETADGKALELIKRFTHLVERARAL